MSESHGGPSTVWEALSSKWWWSLDLEEHAKAEPKRVTKGGEKDGWEEEK